MSSLKGSHRPFVVDVVDEYNDDDDDDEGNNISNITHATSTSPTIQKHTNDTSGASSSRNNPHMKHTTIPTTNTTGTYHNTTTTALTTFQNNNSNDAPSSSKSSKFKFWFLSDSSDTDNNNNNNTTSSTITEDNNNNSTIEKSPQPVSSPFSDRNNNNSNNDKNNHSSTALTVLPSPRSNTTAVVILPKNLVHETIHKQRNRLYQQLHDIEIRTSQLNADLAQEIMNFDTDIKQCMETKLIYNQSTIQQMDLYTFLNSDTSTSTKTTTTNGNSNTITTLQETDAVSNHKPSATNSLQNMISSSSKNWMIYEQRISSLDAQMTHAVHVQLSDLNNEHIHQTIHDIVYTKIPKLTQEAQQYSTKNEQSLIQQWESIVGVMARRYAEERATRIVSYQTILDQIQSLQKQFQDETKKLMLAQQQQQQLPNIDIATMTITDTDQTAGNITSNSNRNSQDIVKVPGTTTDTTATTTTTTMYQLYQEIQFQIQTLQQEIVQEQETRYEQDEQLRALLLHRTEILQQAILETFE